MKSKKSNLQLLILVCMNYFTFALITNIPGALLPYWKEDFNLSSTIIAFLGSAFFLAYGLTSLPQGILLDNIGNKKTFLWGITLILFGSAVFAFVPEYKAGLMSLFTIGIGVTALQMVGNLLVKKIDDNPDKYSRNLTLAQIFCGIGGLGGGVLIGYLIKDLGLEWKSIYFIFMALSAILLVYGAISKIPENEKDFDYKKPALKDYVNLGKNPLMMLFAGAIFVYVGIEVGIATWIATFLVDTHNVAKTTAAAVVGLYWGFQAVGRFTGGFVLNFISSSRALIIYSFCGLISLLTASLSSSSNISTIAFISVGFFTSIMFPSIFSLAVNSFDKRQEGTVAGILCTAIVGGAVIPPIIGIISDISKSLSAGLIITSSFAFMFIAYIGFYTMKNQSKFVTKSIVPVKDIVNKVPKNKEQTEEKVGV
jgi:FHS family L-fucose permease-like MFS transporter